MTKKDLINNILKENKEKFFTEAELLKKIKSLNENIEEKQYMFFSNLKTIKEYVDNILSMNEEEVNKILLNGHEWAEDHIATSKDDIQEVYEFLNNRPLNERKLTKKEKDKKEKNVLDLKKSLPKLKKKYGEDAESVMYGIATNKAKNKKGS